MSHISKFYFTSSITKIMLVNNAKDRKEWSAYEEAYIRSVLGVYRLKKREKRE